MMFKPQEKTTLKNEKETRAMVSWLADLSAIQAAITELDAARAVAEAAEKAAYEATKAAELKESMVAQKEQAVDKLIQANVEALNKAQAEINKAKAIQDACTAKAAAMARWEDEAVKKEADYNEKVATLQYVSQKTSEWEKTVAAREQALQAKLDAFKAV